MPSALSMGIYTYTRAHRGTPQGGYPGTGPAVVQRVIARAHVAAL